MLTTIQAINAAIIGIISYTTCVHMMDKGDIFGAYFQFLDRIKMRRKWYSELVKPIGWCEKCTAGQLAFWYYLYSSLAAHDFAYRPDSHIAFISVAALTTVILSKKIK